MLTAALCLAVASRAAARVAPFSLGRAGWGQARARVGVRANASGGRAGRRSRRHRLLPCRARPATAERRLGGRGDLGAELAELAELVLKRRNLVVALLRA
eukprot:scaffold116968_cov68-Phaeocystis_antarctica.AAC.2